MNDQQNQLNQSLTPSRPAPIPTPESTPMPSPNPTPIPTPTMSTTISSPTPTASSSNPFISTSTAIEQPTQNPEQSTSTSATTPVKKKRTGLIIGVIIALLILLGGGAFTTFAIIKNSPENALSDSLNHLMTADQIAATGSLNLTPKNLSLIGINSINLDFNTKHTQSNQSTEASLQINFTDGTSTKFIDFGEIMLKNGVFYLHVDGLNDIYQNNIRSTLSSYLDSIIRSRYTWSLYENCYDSDSYTDCTIAISTTPELDATIATQSTQLLSQIDQIVAEIDNQWFEFSIEDILNSDFLTNQLAIPSTMKQGIISAYNCSINVINQIADYSDDFSNLFNQYPFIKLTSGQNNYYDVSLDANNLANYLNNIYNLSLYQDLAKCTGTTPRTDSYTISANDVSANLKNLPNVALRFDGFFDHHLTDIKASQSNDYYDLSLDINLTYPTNLQISAPTDSRPIIELVQEVYTIILTTLQN